MKKKFSAILIGTGLILIFQNCNNTFFEPLEEIGKIEASSQTEELTTNSSNARYQEVSEVQAETQIFESNQGVHDCIIGLKNFVSATDKYAYVDLELLKNYSDPEVGFGLRKRNSAYLFLFDWIFSQEKFYEIAFDFSRYSRSVFGTVRSLYNKELERVNQTSGEKIDLGIKNQFVQAREAVTCSLFALIEASEKVKGNSQTHFYQELRALSRNIQTNAD